MAQKSSVFEVTSFRGGLSPYEDKGIPGSFKLGKNLDIRKRKDTLTAGQALVNEGVILQSLSPSISPSVSQSPSSSPSESASPSVSPSVSVSPSPVSKSPSVSPSQSTSPSASTSRSPSVSISPSASPSYSPSSGTTNIFADLILFFVNCTDGNTYGFGNTGIVYKRLPDGQWLRVYNLGQKIIGAAEKPSSSGKTYLVFATSTKLHRKEIPGNASWNDVDAAGSTQGDTWPKTNLTTADWHTMGLVGGDLLIANASVLAFVGYDDSYTNEALDLIPGNIAKTLVERNGRAVIGTYRAADPTKGINGAVDTEVPLMQVGDEGDIYFANFTDSIAAKRLPGGGKVNPGGMVNQFDQAELFDWEQTALSWIDKQSVKNMALLGVFEADSGYGGIYTLGRRDKDHPFVLNLEYALDVDEIGAVVATGGTILASYRSGATFGVKATDPNTKAVGVYEGLDLKAPIKNPEVITTWNTADLYMEPLPSGCSVEFWYKTGKTGSFIKALTADGDTEFDTIGSQEAVFSIGAKGKIFEPRVVLNSYANNTAEIVRIEIAFM